MWRLLQAVVFTLVLFGNIYWEWTPNGLLASLLGVAAAFLVTVTLSGLFDLFRRAALIGKKRPSQSGSAIISPASKLLNPADTIRPGHKQLR